MNPVISIIVPVYKAEGTLQRCIESVLNQTYSSFELILVDDGSPDDSGKLCDHYSEADERIRVFHQENKGVSEARNAGLTQASGEYVCFLDCDDELYPDMLEKYLELIRQYNADALLGSLEVVSDNGKTISGFKNENSYGKEIWEDICLDSQPFGYAGGKMFKANIAREIRFNKNKISQEDLDYNLEVYNRCSSIITTPAAAYIYHYSNSQRDPQILDYIRNQLKLYDCAEANYRVSDKAKKAVLERIATLIYTALYNTKSKAEFDHLTDEINDLQRLKKHAGRFKSLNVKHAVFMEQIIKRNCIFSYVYLRVRKKIAESLRTLKR